MKLIDRAKNIILSPKTEWQTIHGESASMQGIVSGYVVPLAAVPSVAVFLGGILWPYVSAYGVRFLLFSAITTFITNVVAVIACAYVVKLLAQNFSSSGSLERALQLVAYSCTPVWVAGILYLIPAVDILVLIAGLYGIYLLYLGLPVLLGTPQDKVIPFLVVILIVFIVVVIVVGSILSAMAFAMTGMSGLNMLMGPR